MKESGLLGNILIVGGIGLVGYVVYRALSGAAATPECQVGEVKTMTCTDGSKIVTEKCVDGKWTPTENVCPTPPPATTIKSVTIPIKYFPSGDPAPGVVVTLPGVGNIVTGADGLAKFYDQISWP